MKISSFAAAVALVFTGTACNENARPDSGDGGIASGKDGPVKADPGLAKIGDPCVDDTDCPAGGSGTKRCLLDWPGGYCAVEACAQHGHDCPADPGQGVAATTGSQCVLAPTATCLALCAVDADCRPGYVCQENPDAAGHGTAKVCVPKSVAGTQTQVDAGMNSTSGGEMMGNAGDGGGSSGMGTSDGMM